MKYAKKGMPWIATAIVGAGALAVTGGTIAATHPPAPAAAHAATFKSDITQENTPQYGHDAVLHLFMSPMPTGTVTERDGMIEVTGFGFTPGSSHTVEVSGPHGPRVLGTLTASAVGQASATFPAPYGSRHQVIVLDSGPGSDPIAVTSPYGEETFQQLTAVEAGYGTPQGFATVDYNPFARTVTVTLTAHGLTPGAHAAHIHSGSCASQGAVVYMLPDFTADAYGYVNHETRVVTGVTSFQPSSWYLNIHQGNSGDILDAAGNPTVFFRPLLCANL